MALSLAQFFLAQGRLGDRIVSQPVNVAVDSNGNGKRAAKKRTGPSEAKTFWTDFLRAPYDRGLRGVKLVITVDHWGGLSQAGSSTQFTRDAISTG